MVSASANTAWSGIDIGSDQKMVSVQHYLSGCILGQLVVLLVILEHLFQIKAKRHSAQNFPSSARGKAIQHHLLPHFFLNLFLYLNDIAVSLICVIMY